MSGPAKKTIAAALSDDELAQLDRLRERYKLTRAQAVREAVRHYIAAGTRVIPVVDPEPGELEIINRGEAAIARGEYVTLEDLLDDLGADRRARGGKGSQAPS